MYSNTRKTKFEVVVVVVVILLAALSCMDYASAETWYVDDSGTYDFTKIQTTNKSYWIIVDEHDMPLPGPGGWYYDATGGDRGMLNEGDIKYSWDNDSTYTAEVISNPGSWAWGGMWYSLIRIGDDNVPVDFRAIFPYIKSENQGEIIEAEIVVSNVISPSNNKDLELRLEFKDENGNVVYSKSWADLIPGEYPKTYNVSLDASEIGNVKMILWVMDKAQAGDSLSINRVRLKAIVPDMPDEEQAFYWTYSWLMANYDPETGMVQDRSNFRAGDLENIPATAKAAKITYYAYKKGYITYDDAEAIITKIADKMTTVPRGPSGVNALWPHFTQNGGTEVVPPHGEYAGSEWASGDTAYAALDIITALQMIGDPQNQTTDIIDFLQEIDWETLVLEDGGISHGYDYDGNPIPYSWKGFGMETMGVNWAYASATGNVAVMESPPSANGAGFIDNTQYPMVFSGLDRWCNDWDEYRYNMADTQINWYCTPEQYNTYLCDVGLFGLSAAETPEYDSYAEYGIMGKYSGPEDGGGEVIVLHYSGMIADIRPDEAKQVWAVLRDRDAEFLQDCVIISPLNNMESMRVNNSTGKCTINHLKGSWNLALQAEGWALADSSIRNDLNDAILNNTFLNRGYVLIRYMPGDLNWDGDVTPTDAMITLQLAATSAQNPAADVSGDDRVTSLDALMILMAATGTIGL